ncbi:MAG: hypothetical protein WC533_02675 [Candidatus Pacearchaeota archaeon]
MNLGLNEMQLREFADSCYIDAQDAIIQEEMELATLDLFNACVLYELVLDKNKADRCRMDLLDKCGIIPEFHGAMYREARERINMALLNAKDVAFSLIAECN